MSKRSYTQKETEKSILDILKDHTNILYQKNLIGYKGKTKDTSRYYSEVISEVLLQRENLKHLSEIPSLTREKSYKIPSHKEPKLPSKDSNRIEERIAIRMKTGHFNSPDFGKILDYQIPLKNKQTDKKTGKIDLLSQKEKENMIYLLELKKKDNTNDGLLKSVLEIFTYSKIVDAKKLKRDFELNSNCKLLPAVLIFHGSRPDNEYKSNSFPQLNKLIKKLKVSIFFISEEQLKQLPE